MIQQIKKIIIAPDSFKGSLTAMEVAAAIEQGIEQVDSQIDVDKIPLADGGEGTVQALVSATNGRLVTTRVKNPLGQNIDAEWGLLGDGSTAVIEMAAASGLMLIPAQKRNPLNTTTFGTGQLIRAALENGCKKIIVGIGGSATTDFGTGMAQALGVHFFRADGSEINELMNGRLMGEVANIDISGMCQLVRRSDVLVACDVDNPLLGQHGAVYIYSPQKGATPEMCVVLEKHMRHIAKVTKRQVRDVSELAGAGAAGGLGGGLVAFLDAKLQPGVRLILDAVRFRERIRGADLIFTGEGKIDQQTTFGKTIDGVAKVAREQQIPLIAIAGSVEIDHWEMEELGLAGCFSICNKPMPLAEAVSNSKKLVCHSVAQIMSILYLFDRKFSNHGSLHGPLNSSEVG